MATDIFLNAPPIKGSTVDDKLKDQIKVLTYQFGAKNSGTAALNLNASTGGGRSEISDLVITKYHDKSTANLFLFCCNGKPIDECTLTLRRAGGDSALPYLVYTMNTCIVSSFNVIGPDKTDQIVEQIGLSFSKVKMEYQEQKADGTPDGGKMTATWDIAKSKAG